MSLSGVFWLQTPQRPSPALLVITETVYLYGTRKFFFSEALFLMDFQSRELAKRELACPHWPSRCTPGPVLGLPITTFPSFPHVVLEATPVPTNAQHQKSHNSLTFLKLSKFLIQSKMLFPFPAFLF